MNKNNEYEIPTANITRGPRRFRVETYKGVDYIDLGNVERAAEILADFFGCEELYHTLISYLDAGCELVDVEDENGTIVINALRNGCNVGEWNLDTVDPDTVDLLELFNALPNLYN